MLSGRRTAIARLALIVAVVVQLTDGLTFVAGLRSGVPLQAESNPIARDLYSSYGLVCVFDLKLVGVALIIVAVAVAQRMAPRVCARSNVGAFASLPAITISISKASSATRETSSRRFATMPASASSVCRTSITFPWGLRRSARRGPSSRPL